MKYRIVRDRYLGYEVQKFIGIWHIGLFVQCAGTLGPTNTWHSLAKAKEYIKAKPKVLSRVSRVVYETIS